MQKIKDFFARVYSVLKTEYTRVDRTCNACGREIFGGTAVGENLFCPDCYNALPLNNGSICARCGRSAVEPCEVCDDCRGEVPYDMARSAFYYAPPVNRLIREQKYDNRRYLAEVFAPFMAGTLAKSFSDVDVITFVPMTEKARRKRGYNQAELMAREISRLTGIEVEELLVKRAETVRQARLNRKERLSNLKGTIKAGNRQLIANKVVVVVDDVITTGATAEAVASALKRAGAAKVYVLTAASVTDARVARVLGQERSESAVRREKQRLRQMKKLEKERIKAEKSKVD